MIAKTWIRNAVVYWCVLSLFIPSLNRAAETAVVPGLVRDVSLDTGGALRGSVLTIDGKPQPKTSVVLRRGAEVVAIAETTGDGSFAMSAVKPGVYELASAKSSTVYRVWTARTAPPAAKPAAMLVESNTIVRGQEWSPVRRALILSGVIITSGVVGGVIGYNIKDDDSAS